MSSVVFSWHVCHFPQLFYCVLLSVYFCVDLSQYHSIMWPDSCICGHADWKAHDYEARCEVGIFWQRLIGAPVHRIKKLSNSLLQLVVNPKMKLQWLMVLVLASSLNVNKSWEIAIFVCHKRSNHDDIANPSKVGWVSSGSYIQIFILQLESWSRIAFLEFVSHSFNLYFMGRSWRPLTIFFRLKREMNCFVTYVYSLELFLWKQVYREGLSVA